MGNIVRALLLVVPFLRSYGRSDYADATRACGVECQARQGDKRLPASFRILRGVSVTSAEVTSSSRSRAAGGLQHRSSKGPCVRFFGQGRVDNPSLRVLREKRPVLPSDFMDAICTDASNVKLCPSEVALSLPHLFLPRSWRARTYATKDSIDPLGPTRELSDTAARTQPGSPGFMHTSARAQFLPHPAGNRQRETPFSPASSRSCGSTFRDFSADDKEPLTEVRSQRDVATSVRCGHPVGTSGLVAIDKPKGITSLGVCKQISRLVGLLSDSRDDGASISSLRQVEGCFHRPERPRVLERRSKQKNKSKTGVGHAGTLDPSATGVLVVGIGKGTKVLRHFVSG
ncbi:trna pseudouridine synthase b, partial [Cystoisospora suis]